MVRSTSARSKWRRSTGSLVPPLNIGAYDLTHDPFSFAETFGPDVAQLADDAAALAALDVTSSTIPLDQLEQFLTGDLNTAEGQLFAESSDPIGSQFSHTVMAAAGVDSLLAQIGGSLPGPGAIPPVLRPPPLAGGVTIPPPPKAPPVNLPPPPGVGAGGVAPITFPPSPVQPPPVPEPGQPPPPPPSPFTLSVSLYNLTRPQAADFLVGDQYQIILQVMPGGAITVTGSHKSIPFGSTAYGQADSKGKRTITGTMGAGDRGQWVEQWYANGRPIGETLEFNVR